MKTQAISVTTPSGDVSGELIVPPDMTAIYVFAHGAGAGMAHSFMVSLSEELAQHGIATLRFNFPFMENRKGRPDFPPVAEGTVEAAINQAHTLYPDTPIFAGGKSFGGRMSSQLLSKRNPGFVGGLIFVGFPLHPAGQPSVDRADHLYKVNVPMLFLQGTRDTLAEWDLISGVCSSLPGASLVKIEGADHAFKVKGRNAIPELAEAIIKWISKLAEGQV